MTTTKKSSSETGWISLNRAAMLLKVRYQKARDLMNRGLLGEARVSETGRYSLRETDVLAYREAQKAEKAPDPTS